MTSSRDKMIMELRDRRDKRMREFCKEIIDEGFNNRINQMDPNELKSKMIDHISNMDSEVLKRQVTSMSLPQMFLSISPHIFSDYDKDRFQLDSIEDDNDDYGIWMIYYLYFKEFDTSEWMKDVMEEKILEMLRGMSNQQFNKKMDGSYSLLEKKNVLMSMILNDVENSIG
jgi:hypothetical protein